jgi:hypothetical protein
MMKAGNQAKCLTSRKTGGKASSTELCQGCQRLGTGWILVYPCQPDEGGMLSAHWEGESDGETKPMRFTSAKGYAPAVITWAYHMPSAETKICLTRGDDEIWLDLNEDCYNGLMRVFSSTG